MGGSTWSDDSYTTRTTSKVADHGTSFVYDRDIKSGKVDAKVHKTLDPKGLKVRESRDSDAHPTSNAIMVGLDVTGSMSSVIKVIHKKLPTLMGILLRKAYIPDPQVMFSAIGDATCDTSPLQVGQFESGDEMEGDLSNFYLEGRGGGQNTESYELFAYVGARKTSIDCFEKRGKKGYCFIIGDELPYSAVNSREVADLIGDTLEASIPVQKIFDELKEKYTVFYILPQSASGGRDHRVIDRWKELLGGENVLLLEDAAGVSELIAMQIGLCEGSTDLDGAAKDLTDHGTSTALVSVVKNAVSKAYSGGQIAKVGAGTLSKPADKPVKRL